MVIIGQIPKLETSPTVCEARQNVPLQSILPVQNLCVPFAFDAVVNPIVTDPFNARIKALSKTYKNVRFFDTGPAMYELKPETGADYYEDDDHINPDGSAYLEAFYDF